MPRARQSTGRKGTPIIPKSWATAPRHISEQTLTVPVSLRHPGTTRSTVSGVIVHTPLAAYWTGLCRVIPREAQARDADTAGDTVIESGYVLVLPAEVDDPLAGDLATIGAIDATTHPDVDAALAGRTLRVDRVLYGSTRSQRDLVCTLTDL